MPPSSAAAPPSTPMWAWTISRARVSPRASSWSAVSMTRIDTGPAALDGPLAGPPAVAAPPRRRGSGILLHPTSLPGPYGIGDLGPAAFQWVDHLVQMQQKWWQVLPLGPTGYGDSPYQCFSAMAGNSYLISPTALLEEGLLMRS